jgi:hypothetical protein
MAAGAQRIEQGVEREVAEQAARVRDHPLHDATAAAYCQSAA